MSILECTSHQSLILIFCELWWPDSTVQGSCPHKWGQDVSCKYLMRRWQFILEFLFHYTPTADLLHLCFPLGHSGRLPMVVCRFLLPWSRFAENRIVLDNVSWQFGPSSFVLGHFFLLGVGLGLDMKWAGVAKFFGPTFFICFCISSLLLTTQFFYFAFFYYFSFFFFFFFFVLIYLFFNEVHIHTQIFNKNRICYFFIYLFNRGMRVNLYNLSFLPSLSSSQPNKWVFLLSTFPSSHSFFSYLPLSFIPSYQKSTQPNIA